MFHWRKNRMKKIRFESTILQKKHIFIQRKNKKRIRNNQTISIFFSLDFFVSNFFHKKHSKIKNKASPIFFLLFSDSVDDGGTAF